MFTHCVTITTVATVTTVTTFTHFAHFANLFNLCLYFYYYYYCFSTDLIHSKVAELMPMDIKKVRLYRSSRNLIRLLHQGLNALQLDSTGKTLTVEVCVE